MTDSLKLKKIRVNNYKLFKDMQEIEFSANSQGKVVLIIGKNGTGKTILFNAIKDGTVCNEEGNSKYIVETNFDKSLITKDIEWLFFLDGEELDTKYLHEKHGKFLNNTIVEKMNEFLKNYSDPYFSKCIFEHHEKLVLINKNRIDLLNSLASTETIMVNICYLLAVKSNLFPNSFLVLDAPLGRMQTGKRESLISSILDNCEQLVLFNTTMEIFGTSLDDEQIFNLSKTITDCQKFYLNYNSKNKSSRITQID